MSGRGRSLVLAALLAFAAAPAFARRADDPERAVVAALRADPRILPYPVRVTTGKSGEIILSGKVGSGAVHDLVIQKVLDLGLVPHDDLVIDTAEAQRLAVEAIPAPAFVPGFAPRLAPPASRFDQRPGAPASGRIDLTVDEFGRVYLSGVAASEEDRRRIVEEAARVPGVTRVDSDIRVADRPPTPPARRGPTRPLPPPPKPAADLVPPRP